MLCVLRFLQGVEWLHTSGYGMAQAGKRGLFASWPQSAVLCLSGYRDAALEEPR